jgi:hypothetical protein
MNIVYTRISKYDKMYSVSLICILDLEEDGKYNQ